MRFPRLVYTAAAAGALTLFALAANAQVQNPGFDTPSAAGSPVGTVVTQTTAGFSSSAAANWNLSNAAVTSSTQLLATNDPNLGAAPNMLRVVAGGAGVDVYQASFPNVPSNTIVSIDFFVESLANGASVNASIYSPGGVTLLSTVSTTTVGSWVTLNFPTNAATAGRMDIFTRNGAATFRVDRIVQRGGQEVPEPGTLAFLFGGLVPAAGFMIRRRRR